MRRVPGRVYPKQNVAFVERGWLNPTAQRGDVVAVVDATTGAIYPGKIVAIKRDVATVLIGERLDGDDDEDIS